MARKKIEKTKTRTGESIDTAVPGDFCYYLSTSNKPAFAEIKKVTEENGMKVFQLMCQVDFKFINVLSIICAFNEKELKGKKRHELCPEVYK
tara:strand:+ start:464 stop:739 length:276 start_codon:yes stop_codon:yes gene_type:complete